MQPAFVCLVGWLVEPEEEEADDEERNNNIERTNMVLVSNYACRHEIKLNFVNSVQLKEFKVMMTTNKFYCYLQGFS